MRYKYPRKFSTQDAIFPDLEGGSKFPEGIPYFLHRCFKWLQLLHNHKVHVDLLNSIFPVELFSPKQFFAAIVALYFR